MNALNSIRSVNIFLLKYVGAILCIFALSFAALRFVHNKVGIVPYAIAFLFYYLAPFLMWSIPLVLGVLGGWAFGKHGFPKVSIAIKIVAVVMMACLYSAAGIAVVFSTYGVLYPKQ